MRENQQIEKVLLSTALAINNITDTKVTFNGLGYDRQSIINNHHSNLKYCCPVNSLTTILRDNVILIRI